MVDDSRNSLRISIAIQWYWSNKVFSSKPELAFVRRCTLFDYFWVVNLPHSVLIQLATYTFFNFQNLTSGTVLLFFFGLICDIGATRIFLFCRFDLYWACVSPFLAPFCPQNRLFLRYTHITPIFWGQTVPTQWDHKFPTSWGNSG